MPNRAVVRAGTQTEVAINIFVFLGWLAILSAASETNERIFLLAISPLWIYSVIESISRLKTCWIADDTSVRMERNEVLCWQCPWEEFAGYCAKSVPWYRLRARNRFVVLDRKGSARGEFSLPEYRYRDSAFFRRTLELNTPSEFFPQYESPKRLLKTKPMKTIAFGVASWLTACAFLAIGPKNDALTTLQSLLIGSFLTIGSSLLFLSFYDWMRVRGPGASDRTSARPVYGPSFRDWRVQDHLKPGQLIEGKTYGYVDCHNRARYAEEDAKFFEEGRYFFLLLLLFGLLSISHQIAFELVVLEIFAVIWVLCALVALGIRRSAEHLQDRVRLEGATLIVSTNRGERQYDWSRPKTVGFRRTDGWFGLRQKADGYAIDPRYLVEMPSEADIAEILETHRRIEAMI